MRIPWKFSALVGVTLAVSMTALVWKTQSLIVDDKVQSTTDSMGKEIAPLKRLVQDKMDANRTALVRFAALRAASGPGRANGFGAFDVISLMQPTDRGDSTWSPAWIEKGADAKAEQWPTGFETTLLHGLPYAKVHDGEAYWARVADSQGAPIYAVMIPVEVQNTPAGEASGEALAMPSGSGRKAMIVGMTANDPLMSVTDDFIGSTNSVFVVDDRGYVASHVDKANLGALMNQEPIVRDLMGHDKISAAGRFKSAHGEAVLGAYERVSGTNLFAAITTPMAAATSLAMAYLKVAITIAMSVGLFSILAAWWFGHDLQVAFDRLLDLAEARREREDFSSSEMMKTPMMPTTAASGTEDSAAFSHGFAQSIREPLLSILGHAQLMKTKAENDEIRDHAGSIERYARTVRQLIEKIETISHEQDAVIPQIEAVDMQIAIENVLARLQPALEANDVKVDQIIESAPVVRAGESDVELALLHLFENAIEAMHGRDEKTLTVGVRYHGSEIEVRVEDTGIGMAREVRDHAFDPFYKAFENPKRLGLGLTFVKMAARRSRARVELQSAPGSGTTAVLHFSVASEDRLSFEASRRMVPSQLSATMFPSISASATFEEPNTLDFTDDIEESGFQDISLHGANTMSETAADGFEVEIRRPKPRG